MNCLSSSPDHSCNPAQDDSNELTPDVDLQTTQLDSESSDDMPLCRNRPLRARTHNLETSQDSRDRHLPRHRAHDRIDTPLLDQRRVEHQVTSPNADNMAPTPSGRIPNKPRPRPWASKPIMKNDLAAKKELIFEIEKYWGKNFIKTYIPKCHRPLVKRDKGGKRTVCRDHETDPNKWLPSVLKAILMIAKLTQNKKWLKKAMNDVVRYRIKNTGNRKPQLVTTDFDILEDMLVKDWEVSYSFGIRYKHLLVNRQGQQDNDEDIDHILGVESGDENSSQEGANDKVGDNVTDQDDEYIDDGEGSEEEGGKSDLVRHFPLASDSTDTAHRLTPGSGSSPGFHDIGQERKARRRIELAKWPQAPASNSKGQLGYYWAHPCDLTMNSWGRLMHYKDALNDHSRYVGHGMYGGHGGHGAYGMYPSSDGRFLSQGLDFPFHSMYYYTPSRLGMAPAPNQSDNTCVNRIDDQYSPSSGQMRTHDGFEQFASNPSCSNLQPHEASLNFNTSQTKSLGSDTRGPGTDMSTEEMEGSTNELRRDYSSAAAALEAELRATELELKIARLQAKRAALSRQSRAA